MKKIFLIATLVVASMMQALAHSAGDYVYTRNGRYKLSTGRNLLANGNFADGTNGWTAAATSLSGLPKGIYIYKGKKVTVK